MSNIWVFSNNKAGVHGDSDWDMSTVLKAKRYYLKESEGNRRNVKKGDIIILREYGLGYWGSCIIKSDWVRDETRIKKKYKGETGWFPIKNIERWEHHVPYGMVGKKLSNKNFRARIIHITSKDKEKIHYALKSGKYSKGKNKNDKIITLEKIQTDFDRKIKLSVADSHHNRVSRLKKSSLKPKETEATVKVYCRNPDVVAEVLSRADGFCENCEEPAPFIRKKDNTPYLEVHHIIQLANGGNDTVKNAIAVCPNCHRSLHYGKKRKNT